MIDAAVIYRWYQGRGERRFDAQILRMARRYEVDPALVKAVVWQESGFNPAARGRAGEIGLMQVREPTAREWAEAENVRFFFFKNLRDPETNIRVGAWYLGKLHKRYGQTDNASAYALADYNAGRTHVLRWMQAAGQTNSAVFLRQMDFPGTRHYVRSILERCAYYHAQLAKDSKRTLNHR